TPRGLARLRQGVYLSVGLAVALVPTLADGPAVADHDRPDQRVRLDVAAAALRQLQRPAHPVGVKIAHADCFSPNQGGRYSLFVAKPVGLGPGSAIVKG